MASWPMASRPADLRPSWPNEARFEVLPPNTGRIGGPQLSQVACCSDAAAAEVDVDATQRGLYPNSLIDASFEGYSKRLISLRDRSKSVFFDIDVRVAGLLQTSNLDLSVSTRRVIGHGFRRGPAWPVPKFARNTVRPRVKNSLGVFDGAVRKRTAASPMPGGRRRRRRRGVSRQ